MASARSTNPLGAVNREIKNRVDVVQMPMMWPPTDAAAVSTSSRFRSGDDVARFIRDSRRTPSRHFPHPP
jgi:hypothetical protein